MGCMTKDCDEHIWSPIASSQVTGRVYVTDNELFPQTHLRKRNLSLLGLGGCPSSSFPVPRCVQSSFPDWPLHWPTHILWLIQICHIDTEHLSLSRNRKPLRFVQHIIFQEFKVSQRLLLAFTLHASL